MGWILREEIAQAHADNIKKFTKLYQVRIRAHYPGSGNSTIYDTASTTRSPYGYDTSTGIYKFHFPVFIGKWTGSGFASGTDAVTVEYKDFDGEWLLAYTYITDSPSTFHTFSVPNPLLSSEYRILGTTQAALGDGTATPASAVMFAYPEPWFDITSFCSGEIRVSRDIDPLTDAIKLPHFSVGINNSDSRWNKDFIVGIDILNTPKVNIWDSDGAYSIGTHTGEAWDLLKQIGTKIQIEIKFFGTDWEDSDWIIIGVFNIRKFSGTAISGEGAWLAKTELNSPTVEGMTADEIVRDIVTMDERNRIVQLARSGQQETLTAENEYVGELKLDVDVQGTGFKTILDNYAVYAHCQDSKYIYFAVRKYLGNLRNGMQIYRCAHSGDNVESIGIVRPVLPVITSDARVLVDGVFGAVIAETANGASIMTYPREFCFTCDEEYFYCSCLWVMHARYSGPQNRASQEVLMLRLTKDGSGWGEIFGRRDNGKTMHPYGSEVFYIETFATTGLKVRSRGPVDMSLSGRTYDPEDEISQDNELWGPLMLFDDGGTEKLLVTMRRWHRTYTGKIWEFWIVPKDLSTQTKMVDVADGIDIHAIMHYSDTSWFVMYRDRGDSGKTKLGILDRDENGDFYFKTYGEAEIGRAVKSLSFIGDSIYSGGNEYSISTELTQAPGLRQLYQCIFIVDASNIIHEDHAVNNQYLSHRSPLIRYRGEDISKDIVEYGQEYLDGDIFVTRAWTINLKTGYVTLRQVFPVSGVVDTTIRISYDFVNSIAFFIPEADSRLGTNALGKLSQSLLGVYGVNEYAMVEKIPFQKYQFMSRRHSVNEYAREDEDDGEEFRRLNNTIGSSDKLTAFHFRPDFSGTVDALRIPINLERVGNDQSNPDDPVTLWIWIGGPSKEGGGDFSGWASDGAFQDPLEEAENSEFVKVLVTSFYIDRLKVPGSGTTWPSFSPYVWRGFDLSGTTFNVVAGKTYTVILQMSITGDNYVYNTLAKKLSIAADNQLVEDSVISGTDLSTYGSFTWHIDDYGSHGKAPLAIIEIKKSKQEIIGNNIVDTLNPNISSGFVSKAGGSDSTIRVVDANYQNVYTKGVDYSIIYASGFWINFLTFGIDDPIIIQWFESRIDPPLLEDKKQYKLTEDSSYGDDSDVRKVSIIGEKKLPANVNVRINKIFEISPGLDQPVEVTNETSRQGESVSNMKDWNDLIGKYEDTQDSDETKTFAFEFKDPFVAGTTGWAVRYGRGLAGDTLYSSYYVVPSSDDVPLFYKCWLPTADSYLDVDYHVMLKRNNYREWRVATDEDSGDIVGNLVLAVDPDAREGTSIGDPITFVSGTDPVMTGDFFMLKHMNSYYGETRFDFIAYQSNERKFYVNSYGVVAEDQAFDESSNKNPAKSIYPGKTMVTTLSPLDFTDQPLFEFHGDSGTSEGYDSGYDTDVKPWMSTRINRVAIRPRGINADYSNWGTDKQFLLIDIFGYPLNKIIGIKYRKKLSGSTHVDAKEITIDNDLIDSEIIAKLKADQTIDFWGGTRNVLRRETVYNPAYYNGMIVRLTSAEQNYDDQLFYVLGLDHVLSAGDMRSVFRKLLEI